MRWHEFGAGKVTQPPLFLEISIGQLWREVVTEGLTGPPFPLSSPLCVQLFFLTACPCNQQPWQPQEVRYEFPEAVAVQNQQPPRGSPFCGPPVAPPGVWPEFPVLLCWSWVTASLVSCALCGTFISSLAPTFV